MIFTCEFQGSLVKIDIVNRSVVGYLTLSGGGDAAGHPLVARRQHLLRRRDDARRRVHDRPDAFTETGFIPTGIGTHGLYPNRDGTKLYVANRGQRPRRRTRRTGPAACRCIDFATKAVVVTWPIPGGGSPDMGNVSADGKTLWLSGRYDDVVYAIDTTTGERHQDPGRRRAPRPHRLAPARPLLAGPHRQHALVPPAHATGVSRRGIRPQLTPVGVGGTGGV